MLFPASAVSKTSPPPSPNSQKLTSPAASLIVAPATRAPPVASTRIPAQSAELTLMLPSTAWGDPRTATPEEGGAKLHPPVLPPPPLNRVSSYPQVMRDWNIPAKKDTFNHYLSLHLSLSCTYPLFHLSISCTYPPYITRYPPPWGGISPASSHHYRPALPFPHRPPLPFPNPLILARRPPQ